MARTSHVKWGAVLVLVAPATLAVCFPFTASPEPDATTGAGGGTGTTVSTATSTSTGSACACQSDPDCGPSSDCQVLHCSNCQCTQTLLPGGTLVDGGAPNDCTVMRCDGDGGVNAVPLLAGTSCQSSGGKVCDGNGACVECVDDSACTSVLGKHGCDMVKHVCTTCMDGAQNGDETDIDCGGQDCAKCAIDKTCKVDSDCASSKCKCVNNLGQVCLDYRCEP